MEPAGPGSGPACGADARGRRWPATWSRPRRPAHDAWPSAPVPSVPGDVWHWQLEAMHVVSRVRSDLRARIAHPSVSSASTEDARDGLLLVFEELASNALRHGGGDVRALVVAGPGGWLLDLSDEAPDKPAGPRRRPRPRARRHGPAPGRPALHRLRLGGAPRPQARLGPAALRPRRGHRAGARDQLPEPRVPASFHRD